MYLNLLFPINTTFALPPSRKSVAQII